MLNIRHFQFFDLVTTFDYSTKCESCILPYQCLVSPFSAVGVCRPPESSYEHLCHNASTDWAVPTWTSGISARRRCPHFLEKTAGSLSTACPTGKILQLRLHHRPTWSGCSTSVDGWLLAAATDSLKIWRCVCFWNWTKTWCNCVIE